MTTTYRTVQGEMVDAICRRHYGDESGYVEAVLNANSGLAARGPILDAGVKITLPDLPQLQKRVRLVTLGFSTE